MAKILIVDDERPIRETISICLKRDGHDILEADNPASALMLLNEEEPALIISDICMEGIDGLTFLESIRGNPRTRSIPFILITAYPTIENMMKGNECAADGFLSKPFTLDSLRKTVRNRLDRESALRRDAAEVRRQLLRVLEASPDIIAMIDPETFRIFHLNPTGRRILRTGADFARPIATFLPACTAEALMRDWVPAASQHGMMTTETVLMSQSGTHVPVHLVLQAHRREDHGLEYFSIIARDLTEQHEREMTLRATEFRFRCLVDALPDAVVMYGADGRLSFCNARCVQLLRYPAQELLRLSVSDLFEVANPEAHPPETVPRPQGGPVRKEFTLTDKNGNAIPVAALFETLEVEGQTLKLCILHDLTERKRIERERQEFEVQLRQAQKLESIGQLAAGIAHEINTPTQYIGDNTRFLKESCAALAPAARHLVEIVRSATSIEALKTSAEAVLADVEKIDLDFLLSEMPVAIDQSLEGIERVTKIVRAMKDFSHPHAAEKSLIDINSAIESTLTVARNEWKYVAELVKNLQPDLPLVPCLPGEFNQVILNLVVNAAHAISDVVRGSERKGIIGISTMGLNGMIEIRVSDTGTGIPPAARARIFEPFFTTKDVGKGTGQGLAIARSVIVDKHGGSISFETECGKGTTFIVRLPLGTAIPQKPT